MQAVVKSLGYGGLIPFVGLSAATLFLPVEFAAMSALSAAGLCLYSAIILSFLGGLHWGRMSVAEEVSAGWLIWSVMPSLWGWGILWLVPDLAHQMLLLALGLFICWQVDRRAIADGLFAGWMAKLRRDLSVVAIGSLVASAIFSAYLT